MLSGCLISGGQETEADLQVVHSFAVVIHLDVPIPPHFARCWTVSIFAALEAELLAT